MSRKQQAAGFVQPPVSCVALEVTTPKLKITSSSSLSFSLPSSPWWGSFVERSKTQQNDSHKNIPYAYGKVPPVAAAFTRDWEQVL
jgi:hypothetical protein